MKLITFSLWGADPKYLNGALRNAELAKEIYPGWICRFYIAESVPIGYRIKLKQYDNVEIVEKLEWGDWTSMFWRFEPAGHPDVEVMISRDSDSRLNYREKHAVDEWLKSDKGFHIMRDHPWHKYPVLGGMWGAKQGAIPEMQKLLNQWKLKNEYGNDYIFFAELVLPAVGDNVIVHDEFFDKKPFPVPRKNYEFVGQVFDENENTIEEHVEVLRKYLGGK